MLNESYFDKYKINKGDVIGYLVVEPEDLKIQYETKEKQPSSWKRRHPDNHLPKDWQKRWKEYWQKKKKQMSRRQISDFLNRYDFTYAGRDVVNQVGNCTKHHKSGNW